MKRSELKRSSELKRTGFIRRVAATVARWIAKPAKRIRRKPRRNANPAVLAEYAETHEICANCGATWRTFGCWLEVAHILGGRFGRHDVAANLLRLCSICHHEILIGKQQLGFYLWLKQELNELDREALQEIILGCGTSYRLPEPQEPPAAWRRK